MPQLDYNKKAPAARPGMAFDASGRCITAINKDPQAKQIESFDVDTATADEAYSVLINGYNIPIVGTGTDTTDITAFVTAINNNPYVSGSVVAEVDPDSSDTCLVTARNGGIGFTLALGSNAAKMTKNAQTQANAAADPVPFGAAVISGGWVTDSIGVSPNDVPVSGNEKLGKIAKAANLTAQVDNLALTYDAGVPAFVAIEFYDPTIGDWVTRTFEHTMATNADTSVIELFNQINDNMPANTVAATHPTADTLTLTAEVAGTPFRVSYGFGEARDTGAWVHTTNAGVDTDVNKALLGVAELSHLVERPAPSVGAGATTGATEYPANRPMAVKENGRTWVEPEATPGATDPVFVRLVASGSLDTLGGFTPTAGAGVVRLKRASWHLVDGDYAVLQIDAA